ncbi:class I SAM-dependent methyltransferase [Variovorax saccharolyticus]|uniref:class I SAM-dependent methyltransferase n=1 Tax=Variovorax saccharolyticus TaxID=3053516 RepID=UPI002579203B|nr:class I SAM-dependent methyltransferase [Variovorax sp. J22R187]MDM0017570.1 class I SAM-dependent methyltransferase [Variovorax sp. J22R187]
MNDKVDFDDHKDTYNALLRESVGFFSPDEAYFARYKVELVKKAARSERPLRILEYGCGIGRNIPFLKAAFPTAVIEGSDVASASLEMARKENPGVSFYLEDGSHDAEPFDMIFVASVYHHIPPAERSAATASLFRRLRSGGELYVFEHNPYNPVTRRIVNNCPYDADAVLLKPAELRSLIRGASFEVTASAYCLFIPPKLSALAWMERALGWLPLGGQYWVRGTRA